MFEEEINQCEELGWITPQEDCGYFGSAAATSSCRLGLLLLVQGDITQRGRAQKARSP